jgi:hypothetical protein
MVDNTSIMAHRDAELEGGGDHLIDRLLDEDKILPMDVLLSCGGEGGR